MNRFLIYVPGQFSEALRVIEQLGTLRRADSNISVLETDVSGVRVQTELAVQLRGTNFFVAKVDTLGRDGDAAFLAGLEHLLETDEVG